jgi:hypothetical protein
LLICFYFVFGLSTSSLNERNLRDDSEVSYQMMSDAEKSNWSNDMNKYIDTVVQNSIHLSIGAFIPFGFIVTNIYIYIYRLENSNSIDQMYIDFILCCFSLYVDLFV